jgi:ferric iron reductase protein FhuF
MERSYMDLLESNYFLYCGDQKNIHKEVALGDLLVSEKTEQFLQEYGKFIKAPDLNVSATYFSSMFGMTCSAFISMLSLYNVKIPVTPSSLLIQFYHNEQYHFDNIAFKLNSEEWYAGENSESWRRDQIGEFLRTFVAPLLEHIAKVADIRVRELWGQLVVGLDFGFNKSLAMAESEEQTEKLKSDYDWLTGKWNTSILFCDKNPLNFPYLEVESAQDPEVKLRIKPTCCLYYQTEGAKNKCYTCPRLTPSEREKLKHTI